MDVEFTIWWRVGEGYLNSRPSGYESVGIKNRTLANTGLGPRAPLGTPLESYQLNFAQLIYFKTTKFKMK